MSNKIIGSKIATVVGNKKLHEGTLKVSIISIKNFIKYKKSFEISKNYLVHIDRSEFNQNIEIGSKVLIVSCAPVSKLKRFKVIEVLG